VSSKAFPGGAQGVEVLAGAVDLGKTLVLKNCDIASLADPEKLPVSAERQDSKKPKRSSSLCGAGASTTFCGCGGSKGKEGLEGEGLDEDAEERRVTVPVEQRVTVTAEVPTVQAAPVTAGVGAAAT